MRKTFNRPSTMRSRRLNEMAVKNPRFRKSSDKYASSGERFDRQMKRIIEEFISNASELVEQYSLDYEDDENYDINNAHVDVATLEVYVAYNELSLRIEGADALGDTCAITATVHFDGKETYQKTLKLGSLDIEF